MGWEVEHGSGSGSRLVHAHELCCAAPNSHPCLVTPPAAAIPFIVHPIDAAVHALLNATLRPALRRYICDAAGGAQAGLVVCQQCHEERRN